MNTKSIIQFARKNLPPVDALAVTAVVMYGPITGSEVGRTCKRSTAWFAGRKDKINAALSPIGAEMVAEDGGYVMRQITPVVADTDVRPKVNGATIDAASEKADDGEIRSIMFVVGPRSFDVLHAIAVNPDYRRGLVAVNLRGGGFINIPTPDPDGLAELINAEKCGAPHTKVIRHG